MRRSYFWKYNGTAGANGFSVSAASQESELTTTMIPIRGCSPLAALVETSAAAVETSPSPSLAEVATATATTAATGASQAQPQVPLETASWPRRSWQHPWRQQLCPWRSRLRPWLPWPQLSWPETGNSLASSVTGDRLHRQLRLRLDRRSAAHPSMGVPPAAEHAGGN